jgi:hypothetical protein
MRPGARRQRLSPFADRPAALGYLKMRNPRRDNSAHGPTAEALKLPLSGSRGGVLSIRPGVSDSVAHSGMSPHAFGPVLEHSSRTRLSRPCKATYPTAVVPAGCRHAPAGSWALGTDRLAHHLLRGGTATAESITPARDARRIRQPGGRPHRPRHRRRGTFPRRRPARRGRDSRAGIVRARPLTDASSRAARWRSPGTAVKGSAASAHAASRAHHPSHPVERTKYGNGATSTGRPVNAVKERSASSGPDAALSAL